MTYRTGAVPGSCFLTTFPRRLSAGRACSTYRNPNLADAMRVSGLVQRYGVGIPRARRELHANSQKEPGFDVDAHHVRCTVRVRPDWPGNVPATP